MQKIFAGTATADQDVYFNEDFQALETRWNGSTNAYEQHVWDLKYIDAPILRYRDANGHTSSTSTGDGTSEEVLYFTFDANFNITGLVQENQTFVERYVYTPYGDRLVLTGTFGSRASTNYDQQLGHQGLYTDVESGTIYNRGRQGYHTGLGNFTQRDPLLTAYQDGMNLYQGYRGNPVMGTDPDGLQVLRMGGLYALPPMLPPPAPTTPMTPANTSIPSVQIPGFPAMTDIVNAILELQFLVTQANNWNSSSPPWIPLTNECAEQAAALQQALQVYLPNLKYWQPKTDGGATNSTALAYHHHVVVLKPSKSNPLSPVVIDMFKQSPVQKPQICKVILGDEFRASYPYSCGCCKSHVMPVVPPPLPFGHDNNPWHYWHP